MCLGGIGDVHVLMKMQVDGFIKQEEEMPKTPHTDQEQPERKEAKDS